MREFSEQLSDYRLLKDSASWNHACEDIDVKMMMHLVIKYRMEI
jgi:hypothetical protein